MLSIFTLGLCGVSELVFDIHRVAGDVPAPLAEEEPDKDKDGAAEGEETILDWVWPAGSK